MRFYQPTFKDRKTGEMIETAKWYGDFRDHHGTRQRFAGDTDKLTAETTGRHLEDLVLCRKRKKQPQDKLWSWLMEQDTKFQTWLVKKDLAEPQWFPHLRQNESLDSWIADDRLSFCIPHQ